MEYTSQDERLKAEFFAHVNQMKTPVSKIGLRTYFMCKIDQQRVILNDEDDVLKYANMLVEEHGV